MRCQQNILSENFASKKKIMKSRALNQEINSRELKIPQPSPPPQPFNYSNFLSQRLRNDNWGKDTRSQKFE